jgi:maltose alpha-D-glucosyltransferase/alpha-amylase
MDWDAVAVQRRTPDSLLRFMTRLVHQRRATPELGLGESTLVENAPASVVAHRADWQGSTVVAVHNLADAPATAELELGDDIVAVEDLLELREHRVRAGRLRAELGPYGYLWARARRG